ncbi:MAG: hypothetical protein G01um101433_88 [Parcubacteria group bacterium Gr01-1014_33]|nr:MAG: hypothetical protein G01um101433_88 [Parcubacteria group bacterium Gr01-1014_33]
MLSPQEETSQKIAIRRIEIGSTVTVMFQSGEAIECTIVQAIRTDPDHCIISCESPLGKALLGKRAGDTVIYTVDDHAIQVDIIQIFSEKK